MLAEANIPLGRILGVDEPVTAPTDPIPHVAQGAAHEPPAAPRPMTPLARRRAWTEPTVRVWWLIALGILLLIAAYVADRAWAWRGRNKLITDGTPVTAKIVEANGQAGSPLEGVPGSPVPTGFAWQGQPQA